MRIKRTTATLVGAVAVSAAALTSVGAGTADAASGRYIERPCLTSALTSDGGISGDGCSVYGTARWVSFDKKGDMPAQMKADIQNCLVEGAVAAATLWYGVVAVAPVIVGFTIVCVGPSVARALVP